MISSNMFDTVFRLTLNPNGLDAVLSFILMVFELRF